MPRLDSPLWLRLLPIAFLFSLPPFTAEVLSGYQGHADPATVIAVAVIGGPLYGTVAILIREITRRTGRGWPTILLLSAAFGLVQAGLIDQALVNHESLADSPYWQVMPTLLPGIDIDLSQLLVFVGGHLMVTFAAPIALVEGCAPRLAERLWLGRFGLAVVAVLYLGAAGLFHYELVVKTGHGGTPVQLAVVAVVVVALVVLAFALPRRRRPRAGWTPPPWLVAVVSLVLVGGHVLTRQPESTRGAWPVVAGSVGLLALFGWLLWWSSRGAGWTRTHVVAAGAAPLVVTGLLAFAVPPVGTDDVTGKYVSNAVVLGCLLLVVTWAWLRTSRSTDADVPARS